MVYDKSLQSREVICTYNDYQTYNIYDSVYHEVIQHLSTHEFGGKTLSGQLHKYHKTLAMVTFIAVMIN